MTLPKLLWLAIALLFAAPLHTNAASQFSTKLWQSSTEPNIDPGNRHIVPEKYQHLQLKLDRLKEILANAPLEFTPEAQDCKLIIELPMPNGEFQKFSVLQSPIMQEELARNYPQIKTFRGQGIDDPSASLRFDYTEKGFHAMIMSSQSSSVFIDPYSTEDAEHYISYYKKDFKTDKQFLCLVDEQDDPKKEQQIEQQANLRFDGNLHTYRLAMACTGEYASFHGGTTAGAMSGITTTVNRVNLVYERDLSTRFELIANNDDIIYLNGNTDPYSNNNANALINENQSNIDNVIGSSNYDVGHVVSTGGGGLAGLGVICSNGNKARGITGSGAPIGDPFDIDYVAHEIGHQFGGSHTFNGSDGSCGGNRSASSAYEPGSGTTIQAYAGICSGDNTQSNSDDHFHMRSLLQMTDEINSTSCEQLTATGNSAPVSNAGSNYVIPVSTPFTLFGSASDADGDAVSYCWEQYDLGPAGNPNNPSGDAPIFRSFSPTSSPDRTCPQISDIINNTQTTGEILPSYARTMHFRLVVRDNNSAGGCYDWDEMEVDVSDSAGPFLVTSPNTVVGWQGNSSQTITWDVANTNAAPVSCSQVDILLSTDGGLTYPITLASNVSNDGSHSIISPNIPTTTARVKVVCSDNIFFDISNTNFNIVEDVGPNFIMNVSNSPATTCAGFPVDFPVSLTSNNGFNSSVSFNSSGEPAGVTVGFSPSTVTPTATSVITVNTPANLAAGTYGITINANGGGQSQQSSIELIVTGNITSPPSLQSPSNGDNQVSIYDFTWSNNPNASEYEIEISTNSQFSNIIESATLNTTSYTASNLAQGQIYYWRVRSSNNCSQSNWSSAFNFTTAVFACSTFNSQDVPVSISANGPQVESSTLSINTSGTILDVNVVDLSGDHTYVSDLTFTITSPSGTSVIVWSGECGQLNNFDFGFDDDAADSNWPCPPTDGGTYQPISALSAFNDEEMNGTWTLTINDAYDEDGGSLNSWGLEICYAVVEATGPLTVDLKVMLEGAYLGAQTMATDLQSLGLIPTNQPYATAPWNHGGGETLPAANNIVDWVLVQAREATSPEIVVEQHAAVLLNDGSIVDASGSGDGVLFTDLTVGSPYHFAVHHRNHMAVMTKAATDPAAGLIDLTDNNIIDGGNSVTAGMGGGVRAMLAGDFDGSNVFTFVDFNQYIAKPSEIYFYEANDCNLDGFITVADYNFYKRNFDHLSSAVLQW